MLGTTAAIQTYAGNPTGFVAGEKSDECLDTTVPGNVYKCTAAGNTASTVWQLMGLDLPDDETRIKRADIKNITAASLVDQVGNVILDSTIINKPNIYIQNFSVILKNTIISANPPDVAIGIFLYNDTNGENAICWIPTASFKYINTLVSMNANYFVSGSTTIFPTHEPNYYKTAIPFTNTSGNFIKVLAFSTGGSLINTLSGGPFDILLEYSYV